MVAGTATNRDSDLGVRVRVLALLLFAPSLCFAGDISLVVASRVLDWGQTRYIVQHPETFYEMNRKMGDHPSMGTVNRHFSQLIIRDVLLGSILSPPFDHLYFGAVSFYEVKAIRHNRSMGVKFSF